MTLPFFISQEKGWDASYKEIRKCTCFVVELEEVDKKEVDFDRKTSKCINYKKILKRGCILCWKEVSQFQIKHELRTRAFQYSYWNALFQ